VRSPAPDIPRLQAEVDRLQRAQMAVATEKGYAHDWRTFQAWCDRAKRQALPASPETLSLFIADQLARKKVVTVCRYAAGVAFVHRREGYPSPADDSVHRTLRGARRTRAEQPRQMRPLSIAQIRKIAAALKGSPAAVRNRAIVLVGFATALRRINLAALRVEDLTFCQEGFCVLVKREKQNREGGAGRTVAVPFGAKPLTCPLRALLAWLKIRGRHAGPLFSRLDSASGTADPLSTNAIGNIVKAAIAGAGIDARQYGPHSLRSGFITEAGIAGASTLLIAAHVGHKSVESTARYFRPAGLFRANCAGLVGL
jgi:integrase